MDFLKITIPDLLKNADLQSAFLIEVKKLGIKVNGTCTSCIVGYYQQYLKRVKMSKDTTVSASKYRVVNNGLVQSPYSTPISNANITDELVEKLLSRQPNAAAHFERVDGKPIGYVDNAIAEDSEQNELTVNATPAAIKLAEANGIDITTVTGTGKDGRISVGDVKDLL